MGYWSSFYWQSNYWASNLFSGTALVEGTTGATESFDAWVAGLFEGAIGATESFDAWDFVAGGDSIGSVAEAPPQMGYSHAPLGKPRRQPGL